jgi:PKD repeat protein
MRKSCIIFLIILLVFTSLAMAEDFRFKSFVDESKFDGKVEYAPGEILVKFKEGVSKQQMADLFSAHETSVLSVHRGGVKKLRVPAGKTEHELISLLERDPRVEYAELNTICHAFMTPNDPYYSPYQWHFPKINCPAAWDISTGSSVLVGILDSGIAYEDFAIPSYELNTVQSGVTTYMQAPDLAGTAFASGYDFINDDTHPNDNNGHGTHVAGTVAQTTNNSYGVAGMAFDCTLMPVKVLDYTGSGTAQTLADGLYWATDHGAQVINMSLGWPAGYNPGSTVQNAIQYAYNHGVVLVAASGNEGVSPVSYPAAYSQCIAVGATRYDDDLSYYSQYGSAQEVVAPGGDINVDQNGDSYGDGVLQQSFDPYDPDPPVTLADPTSFGWWFYQGTSQAAPHVSALVAMMIANNQTGIENIRNILHETAVDLGSSGWDQYYGYGRIDAYAALTYGGNPPVAEFSGSPTSGCAPLTVDFTDESSNDPTSWSWDFGDGGTSYQQNPSYTYDDPGTYTVSLTATNEYGSDTETKTGYITVSGPPTADFSGSPTSGEVPLTVNFTNLSTGASSYSWDFGDTGSSTQANPSHTYTEAGTYTVTLTATNSCGSDVEVKTNYITVTCTPPTADFSGSPTSGEVPLTVNFTDQSTGATSWSWDFGDEGTSSQQNPSHQYTEAGTYTVTLTATNSCGSDVETKTDYITVTCTAPVADFYGSPTSGNAPLIVSFYDQSTGNVTSWDWDFGDGSANSSDQNPVHEYADSGHYTVSLTVTGPCGSDSETKTDYIEVTEAPSDYADLPYTTGFETGALDQYWITVLGAEGRIQVTTANGPHSGSYHLTMDDHTNGGSYSQNEGWLRVNLAGKGDVELTFWWKEFSDETHTQDGVFFSDNGGSSFAKVYDLTGGSTTWEEIVLDVDQLSAANGLSLTGTFVIKFQQYDNYGITYDGMAFDDISVISLDAPPVADFVGSPTSGTVPLTVDFTDQSSGNPTSWSWDFGDGVGTSTQQNPSYIYNEAGTYTVTLTVTNAFGSDDEVKVDYITVTPPPPPTADFVGEPTSGYAPLTVDFTDQSTGNPTSWSWDFGDGVGTSTEQNPSYTYNDVGTYTVTLTATNAYGSDDEVKTDYITVSEPGENMMHVHSITVTRQSWWRWVRGIATITIYDQGGAPVSGATVYGVFSGPTSDSRNGTTNGNGQVTFYSGFVRNPSSEWCFEVTNVTKTDWTYDPDANEVTKACESGPVYKSVVAVPEQFSLSQNYPNPFNLETNFSLSLPAESRVDFVIYNVAGQKVKTLVNDYMNAGTYTITWDGTNEYGNVVSSGIYFYRLVAGDNVVTKKMILMK